eukprot:CAMPEP_0202846164 /NCGR_PEP_ID=MMETSP1389-20130828/71991_1 /ASSEMBLY_ACC=CAM_ASM_000865 /TAXON_ID=302021 /ORGANISM="Rhodomonas sp., Strain CCMP768" /LENGTH=64 /DNA_ID=CAMNT_0049523701 /DNA_START=12 /DNA_END=203 /DNA_ORIENTATION=+
MAAARDFGLMSLLSFMMLCAVLQNHRVAGLPHLAPPTPRISDSEWTKTELSQCLQDAICLEKVL